MENGLLCGLAFTKSSQKTRRLGILEHIAERLLNQNAQPSKSIMTTYNTYDYFEERRDALQLWAEYLFSPAPVTHGPHDWDAALSQGDQL